MAKEGLVRSDGKSRVQQEGKAGGKMAGALPGREFGGDKDVWLSLLPAWGGL